MSGLDDDVRKLQADFLRTMLASFGTDTAEPNDEPMIYNVKKYGYVMPVSTETLIDYALIPDTRPPYVPAPVPLRERLRARVEQWRMQAGSWIAGTDLDHECDTW